MSHLSNYIGIFLDQNSKGLLYKLKKYAPSDWTWYGDHMTIKYFGSPRYAEDFPAPYNTLAEEGQDVSLVVSHIAISDKVMGVKVSGYTLDDKISHITLAVSKTGTPSDSKNLTEWKRIKTFTLHGTIRGNGDTGEVIHENEIIDQSLVKKGSDVSTGGPITIHYIKNTEKAPNMGKRFGQDVEPNGFYVTQQEYSNNNNWEMGIIEFKSPLVIDVNNDTLVEWKRSLSKHMRGLKGVQLTQALQTRGYDGIITRHNKGHLGEIIAFSNAVIRKKETSQDELQETDETSETVIPMGVRWNDQMDGGDYATTVWAAPTTRVKYGGTMAEQTIKKLTGNILNETTYKVYHGTNEKFSNFNFKQTTQGIVWFTDNIDSIKNQQHGGQGNKFIMTRYITINNPASWTEYDKWGLQQLEDKGYDGVILPSGDKTDYFVFSPKSIRAKAPQDLNETDSYSDTQTSPFKNWFGKSQIVDKQGAPLVVYHGTPFGKFNNFKGENLYFSTSKEFATDYAEDKAFAQGIDNGVHTFPVYLKANNVFDANNEESITKLLDTLPDKIPYGFADTVFTKEQLKYRLQGNLDVDAKWTKEKIANAKFGEVIGPDHNGYNNDIFIGINNKNEVVYTHHHVYDTIGHVTADQKKDLLNGLPVKVSGYRIYGQVYTADTLNQAFKAGEITDRERIQAITDRISSKIHPYTATQEIQNLTGQDTWTEFELNSVDLIGKVRQLGYDAIKTSEHGALNYIVFSPTQVKSAVNNSGEFNTTDSNIFKENDISERIIKTLTGNLLTESIDPPSPFVNIDPKIKDYHGMFSTQTSQGSVTDLIHDDVQGGRGYFYFYKWVSADVIMMSPDQYLDTTMKEMGITRDQQNLNITDGSKATINKAIEQGYKIDMPYLKYSDNGFNQEGRNRAVVAKERGEKLIPVAIVRDITIETKIEKAQELINIAKQNVGNDNDKISEFITHNMNLHRDAIQFTRRVLNNELNESVVNMVNENKSDTFKNWFKNSKVVDTQGKPLVVYHGTTGIFDEFKVDKLGSKNALAGSSYEGFFFAGSPDTANSYTSDITNLQMKGWFGNKEIKEIYTNIQNKYKTESGKIEAEKNIIWKKIDTEVNQLRKKEAQRLLGMIGPSMGVTLDQIMGAPNVQSIGTRQRDKYEAELNNIEVKQRHLNTKINNETELEYNGRKGLGANIMPIYLSIQNPLTYDFKNEEVRSEQFSTLLKKAKKENYDGAIFTNVQDGNTEFDNIYIVFNPTQIKSATGNSGTYDPTNPDIIKEDDVNSTIANGFNDKIKEVYNIAIQKGFDLIPFQNVDYDPIGIPNKCETNAFNVVKSDPKRYYPVGGWLVLYETSLMEHWWVYDIKENKHVDVTPSTHRETITGYLGIINKDINNDISKISIDHDFSPAPEFFKGGNIYFQYIHPNIVKENNMTEQTIKRLVTENLMGHTKDNTKLLNEMPTTFPGNIGGVQATFDSWTDHPGDRNINETENTTQNINIDGTNLPIMVIPRDQWVQGKDDSTEYSSSDKHVRVRDDYDYKGDPLGNMRHELIHYVLDMKGVVDDNKPYPQNNIEQKAYTNQFKYLKNKGYTLNTALKLIGKEHHKPILSQYWDTLNETVIKEMVLNEIEEITAKLLEGEIDEINGFHGSPHSFDKFSTNNISSGEGVQAFGWGLYFTDKENIAMGYANALAEFAPEYNIKANGKDISQTPLKEFTRTIVKHTDGIKKGDLSELLKDHEASLAGYLPYTNDYAKYWIKKHQKAITFLRRNPKIEINLPRNVYSVKIHGNKTVDELNFLRWDKQVPEPQLEGIINKLKSEYHNYNPPIDIRNIIENPKSFSGTGGQLYAIIAMMGAKEASLMLLNMGIDGIQYPTNSTTRGSHDDSFNYVIFDENAVEIANHNKLTESTKLQEVRHENPSWPNLEKVEPLRDNESIIVYHGFSSHSETDAMLAVQHGISGQKRVSRTYSYESVNNPKGLFVSIDFSVVKREFANSGIIIEFSTKASNLEAPVWHGGGSYFVQGDYTTGFNGGETFDTEREQQRLDNREREKTNKVDGIAQSDRPELAQTLFQNSEKQALFIGNLNPNMIRAVWVHEGHLLHNTMLGKWVRMSRIDFIRKYVDESKFNKGDKYSDVKNKIFKPNDDLNIDVLKTYLDDRGWVFDDFINYYVKKKDDYMMNTFFYPKQIRQLLRMYKPDTNQKIKEITEKLLGIGVITETVEQKFAYSDVVKVEQALLTHFSETSPTSAAYITPNGKFLDVRGAGGNDHRYIGGFIEDLPIDWGIYNGEEWENSHSKWLYIALDMGFIRLIPESGHIEMRSKPEQDQFTALRELISARNGRVMVDLGGTSYMEYQRGTPTDYIIEAIKRFYNYGEEQTAYGDDEEYLEENRFTKQKLQEMVSESKNKRGQLKRLVVFDMDSTLVNSPTPETGRSEWKEKTGREFPSAKAWWSVPESLDTDVFNISTIQPVFNKMREEQRRKDTIVVVMTNRLDSLEREVKRVLKVNQINPAMLSMAEVSQQNKGDRILDILKDNPTIRYVAFYDDMEKNIGDVRSALKGKGITYDLYDCIDGQINRPQYK